MAYNALRVGLVGCSWFALRAHVPALLALEDDKSIAVKLTAVCSRTKKSMAKAEAKIGREVKRHAKMEQMFSDPDIDAVLLVLPIPLMPAAIEAALRAGKHVLSEKPAAPSMEAAQRLLGVQRELGAHAPEWLVLENWSTCKPSIAWMRERLQEDAIGPITTVHCAFDHADGGAAAGSWRDSPTHAGGWLVDVGVHWARALRVLLGEPRLCSATITAAGSIARRKAQGGDGVSSAAPPAAAPAAAAAAEVAATAGPAAGSVQSWVRFEHCGAAATVCMSYGTVSSKAHQSASSPPALRITGERGCLCWWPNGDPLASTGSGGARGGSGSSSRGGGGGGGSAGGRSRVTLERAGVAGVHAVDLNDDWVSGGVQATLSSALLHLRRRIARSEGGPGSSSNGSGSSCSGVSSRPLPPSAARAQCSCSEAVRDLSLVLAMLRSDASGRTVAPHELFCSPGAAASSRDESMASPPPPPSSSPPPSTRSTGSIAAKALLQMPPAVMWDASGTWSFTPAGIVPCATVGEVVAAVQLAAGRGIAACAVGSLHSWSRPAATDGTALCLEMGGMDRVLGVDGERQTIRVEPGCTLREVRRVLASNGLTLASYPMLLDQSVGGAALGCGSHGSAPGEGTIADAVVAMTLVAPDGSVREVSEALDAAAEKAAAEEEAAAGAAAVAAAAEKEEEVVVVANEQKGDGHKRLSVSAAPPPSLHAARVSLGLLGVAVGLTLRCVPRYYVRRHMHTLRPRELIERLEALCHAYRHVWVWWALGEETLCACGLQDVGDAPAHNAVLYDGENWYHGAPPLQAPKAMLASGAMGQSQADVGGSKGAGRGGREGGGAGGEGSEEGPGSIRSYSMQYAVPRERASEMIACLDAHAGEIGVGRVVELKLVGAGASLLGLNSQGAVACANVLWQLKPSETQCLVAFERALIGIGAWPHLGKLHGLTPKSLSTAEALGGGRGALALPPAADRFATLVEQVDPHGTLGGRAAAARLWGR